MSQGGAHEEEGEDEAVGEPEDGHTPPCASAAVAAARAAESKIARPNRKIVLGRARRAARGVLGSGWSASLNKIILLKATLALHAATLSKR